SVPGIEVDSQARALDQAINSVKAVRKLAVLLVAFQPNKDPARLGDLRRLHQGVAHQNEILLFAGPPGFGAFVGIDYRRAAFGGEADSLLEVFGADFRLT